MSAPTDDVLRLFERTTEQVVTMEEFRSKLALGRPLRIKYGVDVTAPFMHIGHAVNLWMMRDLQERGHTVVFLIGDFTTRIGDPTGKSKTRPVIDRDAIEANSALFIEQVSRILLTEPAVLEIRRNSEWWESMPLDEFLSLLAMTTHGRLIARDMFERRIAAGDEIYLHELLYPILQGYDSFALDSDLTIVGTDQLFNEMIGRFYQQRLGQDPQVVLTTRLTPGTDGKEKQSKSLGNYIAIDHSPREMFGRAMAIPDHLIVPYLEVYTTVPMAEVRAVGEELAAGGTNPMARKLELAAALVARYYGEGPAQEERAWFDATYSRRETPTDIPAVTVPRGTDLLAVLQACLPGESRSEHRRLVKAGAVSVDGVKLEEHSPWTAEVDGILRVGRRRWFDLRVT